MTEHDVIERMYRAFHEREEPQLRQRFRQRHGFELPPITCTIEMTDGHGRIPAAQATLRQHRQAHRAVLDELLGADDATNVENAKRYRQAALEQFDALEHLAPGLFDQTIETLTNTVN